MAIAERPFQEVYIVAQRNIAGVETYTIDGLPDTFTLKTLRPEVPAGATLQEILQNTDIIVTVTDATGASTSIEVR